MCNAVALNVTLGGIEWQSNKSGRVDLFWKQRRAHAGKLSFFVSYLLSLFAAIFRISKTGDATYIFPDTSQGFRLGHIPCLRPIGSAAAALPRHDSPRRNRPGQDFSYTVLHEGPVNFDSNSCQLRKFAPVDFDSSQRSSVTLVTAPNTLSVTVSDPHPSTVTLRIVFRNA